MAGIHILKNADNLSDEELCTSWVENPYYQYFCGEEFYLLELPFDRSSMARWHQRMGEEKIAHPVGRELVRRGEAGSDQTFGLYQGYCRHNSSRKECCLSNRHQTVPQAREKLIMMTKDHGIKLRQFSLPTIYLETCFR